MAKRKKLPKDIGLLLGQVKGKRSLAVINHIVKHGVVTTEDLEAMGYSHPPRAVRDVREQGIPIVTERVKGKGGKNIAAYRFGDISDVINNKLDGRRVFPKAFKKKLLDKFGGKCLVCGEEYEDRYLQIDHRVPYEVLGDSGEGLDIKRFMLVCATCNRKKSWSCEHCENWRGKKEERVCRDCFWADPDNYSHVAQEDIRRVELVWKGSEVASYDKLRARAKETGKQIGDYIKRAVNKVVNGRV